MLGNEYYRHDTSLTSDIYFICMGQWLSIHKGFPGFSLHTAEEMQGMIERGYAIRSLINQEERKRMAIARGHFLFALPDDVEIVHEDVLD